MLFACELAILAPALVALEDARTMDETRLRELMTMLEADWIERTVTTKNRDKFGEAICAFANDLPGHGHPGYLLVGVDDKTGQAVGMDIGDRDMQTFGGLRSQGNVLPIPAMSVTRIALSDGSGDVAVIAVHPSDMPPVRYKGNVWIRVGPRRGIASEQEERMLRERRISSARTFDLQPCTAARLNDLIPELFVTYRARAVAPEIIEENHRSLREQMSSLRMYDMASDRPTNAGILLFAKSPDFWLPGAYVQFLRIAGTQLSDDIEQDKMFSGDLLTVLRELDMFLDIQTTARPVATSALGERMAVDYPRTALRELLMNAILHRDYESNAGVRFYWFEDRIEIQNPGGLYGAAEYGFPNQNDYRNPVLAEAMKFLGYVNRYGRGVIRAQEALKQNGNPPAEFNFEARTFTQVVVRRAP